MTTYIAPIGHGLGDLVVSLPVVQWLIEQGEPTILVLRSPRQEGFQDLIAGLAGSIREQELQTRLQPGDRYINLRDHPLQTDNIWGSAEFDAAYPGYKIADIVRDISHDFGIKADFENLKPLPFTTRVDARGKVLLIPGTDGEFKCWPTDCWLEIAERLRERGESFAVIGQPHRSGAVKELITAGLPWIETPTLRDALDVVSSAAAAISVDTGLLHLTLQQLVPVAGMWINNPGSLNYMRTVRHCFAVVSPRCLPACVSEELDKNLNEVTQWTRWCGYDSWTCHASISERCMNNVSVQSVWEQAIKALEYAGTATRI